MSVKATTRHTAQVNIPREDDHYVFTGAAMDGSLYVQGTSEESVADAKANIARFARAVLEALEEDE